MHLGLKATYAIWVLSRLWIHSIQFFFAHAYPTHTLALRRLEIAPTQCTVLAKMKPLKPINCIICILFAVKLQSHFIDHWILCELNVHSFTAQINWNAIKCTSLTPLTAICCRTSFWRVYYAAATQKHYGKDSIYYNIIIIKISSTSHQLSGKTGKI